MIIAVLKETADYERRVALTPPAAQKLTADGTKIKMEKCFLLIFFFHKFFIFILNSRR